MNDDKKNIGVLRKLPMQGMDKVQRRVAIIHCQRTPHSHHTNLFLDSGINLAGHCTLEGRNILAAVPLLSEAECLLSR